MSKLPTALIAVVALVTGCVSITAPSAAPSVTPAPATPAPTSTPSAAPTASPTASPVATVAPTPSATPSVAPTEGPTAVPTQAPSELDTRDLLFSDDMTDPSSGWAVGQVTDSDATVGTISYAGDRLRLDVQNTTGWLATSRVLDGEQSTMRMAAQFVPQGPGRFGLLCDANDTDEWGALVDTDGSWFLGNLTNAGFDTKVKQEVSGLNIPINQSTLMAVECSGLATGKVRITLWLDGTGPVAVYETDAGPDTFNRAGIYAEALGAPTTIDVGDIITFGDSSDSGEMTDAGLDLMTHIPSDWVDSCYQSVRPPLYGRMAEAVVTCFMRKPGDNGAEIAEYASYLSPSEMDAAYQQRVSVFGSSAGTGSCEVGSSEQPYNIDGVESGRLLCVDQFRGIRFDWTDTRLNILSSLVDFDSDYSATFADWRIGGPDL
ncbi:MAG: hypothetical protein ABI744_01475 [Chloroflexota bacterium]